MSTIATFKVNDGRTVRGTLIVIERSGLHEQLVPVAIIGIKAKAI